MVIIYINFVELESSMLHAKFQDHRTSGSGEEDFFKVCMLDEKLELLLFRNISMILKNVET